MSWVNICHMRLLFPQTRGVCWAESTTYGYRKSFRFNKTQMTFTPSIQYNKGLCKARRVNPTHIISLLYGVKCNHIHTYAVHAVFPPFSTQPERISEIGEFQFCIYDGNGIRGKVGKKRCWIKLQQIRMLISCCMLTMNGWMKNEWNERVKGCWVQIKISFIITLYIWGESAERTMSSVWSTANPFAGVTWPSGGWANWLTLLFGIKMPTK